MFHVTSSSIDAIGYDGKKQELYVRFLESGETYVYFGVKERAFSAFMQADSKGRYFNAFVKDRYPYQRLPL